MNTSKEVSLSGIYIAAILGEYNKEIMDICILDPQFDTWKQMDHFFRPNRSATRDL